MRVNRIEDPEGSPKTIELTHTGSGNFKDDIKSWIQIYYSTWNYETFFNRLITFQAGSCILDVEGA